MRRQIQNVCSHSTHLILGINSTLSHNGFIESQRELASMKICKYIRNYSSDWKEMPFSITRFVYSIAIDQLTTTITAYTMASFVFRSTNEQFQIFNTLKGKRFKAPKKNNNQPTTHTNDSKKTLRK